MERLLLITFLFFVLMGMQESLDAHRMQKV